jgi:hypothetical protein
MTGEHLWPNWLSEAWNIPTYEATLRKLGPSIRSADRKWSASAINLEIKPVCEKCNCVTLSTLENRVKNVILPMSYGQAVELSSEDQTCVSAWITRMAILFDFAHPAVEGMYFSNEDRKSFIETLEPFNDSYVWIGVFRANAMRTGLYMNRTIHGETREGTIVATGIVGCLAFQLLSRRWNERPSDGIIYSMMYSINKDWESAVHLIWPSPQTVIQWPIKGSSDLTPEDFNAFADRWGGKSIPLE